METKVKSNIHTRGGEEYRVVPSTSHLEKEAKHHHETEERARPVGRRKRGSPKKCPLISSKSYIQRIKR